MDKEKMLLVKIPRESFLDMAKMFAQLAVQSEFISIRNCELMQDIMFEMMKRYFTKNGSLEKNVHLHFPADKLEQIFSPILLYFRAFQP
jgi:hypothetical protein